MENIQTALHFSACRLLSLRHIVPTQLMAPTADPQYNTKVGRAFRANEETLAIP
jgi:hypothetical protein